MFQLNAFGGLALTSSSGPLSPSVHQRRRLTLLVRLAAAGAGGVSRDRLLTHLWPDSSTERAQHALEQLLYATRRDLCKQSILAAGGQLRLNAEVIWSDVAEFDARLARGEWENATTLYGGPFLDGVHLGGGPELEQWIDAERSRWETHYVEALARLGREAAQRGDVQAALTWWRRRAAAQPLSACGARDLVQALIQAGDPAGALQYARTYGTIIRQQLDVEPDPEILILAERQDLAPTPAARPSVGADALGFPPRGDTTEQAAALPRWESATDLASAQPGQPGQPARTDTLPLTPARPPRRPLSRDWRVALLAGIAAATLGSAFVLWRSPSPPAQRVQANSVAVLPFEDLSADGSAEYLGEGMSEELIHVLAQIPDLKVAARTSAFAFKEQRADIREIARSLGVSTIVEGSVRRERDRLRVTAQLIDANTGYHLWSGSFDRQIGDALAIQDEIAGSIARTLRPQLTGTTTPLRSSAPENARAYHLYLQGRHAWNQRTESSLRRAVQLFEKAIGEDPAYAAAFVGLADAHDALVDGGFDPADLNYRKAEAAARRAIALDSTLAEAHAALAHLQFHRWDWPEADQGFRRALELNPGSAAVCSSAAMPLVMQGRFDEGISMMRKAQEVDPLSLGTHNQMGWFLFLAERHEEAIDQLRAVIAMDSLRVSSHARLGLSLVERGQYTDGVSALERAVGLGGDYYRSALPMLGYAYARAGRGQDAERIRARVEKEMTTGSINPYYAAALMGALGKEDHAFALLDFALRTNPGCLIDLRVDPMMRTLRRDARYTGLVQALGGNPLERGS